MNKYNYIFLKLTLNVSTNTLVNSTMKSSLNYTWDSIVYKLSFLPKFFIRSENIWNDGFLFDFLQKKTLDNWVRNYVIYTGFLFSERVVFDAIIRLYNDILVWPLHNISIFDFKNTISMLLGLFFVYILIYVTVVLLITVSL